MSNSPAPTPDETAPAEHRNAPNLPNPKHARRLPAHIGKAEFALIRNHAYALPQVVKPADFLEERSPGFEQHLDKLGYVLLAKPAAGARPSRWIHPALMDAALAHMQAVGTGPEMRPLMVERSAVLDSLGVAAVAATGPA